MRPDLLKYGGMDFLRDYEATFNALYCSGVVTDVFGKTVLFNARASCKHVCFGSPKYFGDPSRWGQARAERIPWIGPTLSNAAIELCQDPHPDGDRRRYLWQVPEDAARGLKQEYYCVIVQNRDDDTVSFITSYDIDRKQWLSYRAVKPRHYPAAMP
jgi:hypothetical protein